VSPPRAAFLNYPLGHATGKPFELDDQVGIVRASLSMLETATGAPSMVELPNSWEDIAQGWETQASRRADADDAH